MLHVAGRVARLAVIVAAVLYGCSSEPESGGHREGGGLRSHPNEHVRDGGEPGGKRMGQEGEESGVELPLTQSCDKTRNGARLILAYDAESHAFVGTVQNTTTRTLKRVRVEVHLSNGKELGPTPPVNLAPGQRTDVKLAATSRGFGRWTAHPEVGSGEHGDGEGHGESGREEQGEHGDRGRGEHDRDRGGEHR